LVWFWQSGGAIALKLKSGKRKIIYLCIDCAKDILSAPEGEKDVVKLK
jgi:hypothetical protein